MSAVPSARMGRRMTDAPTRLFHGLLAACFVGAHLSAESERLQRIHAFMGYTMVALLVFRFLYGWWGPRPVRWSSLVMKLRNGWACCRSVRNPMVWLRTDARPGHNFALVLATTGLLVLPLPLLFSGHVLYARSADWLEEVHEFMANAMLLLVFLHLALLLVLSILRKKNLAWPMWRARVPETGPDLVASPRLALALCVLVMSCSFGIWAAFFI